MSAHQPTHRVNDLAEFACKLGEIIDLDLQAIRGTQFLIEDLGFDSLSLITVVMWFDEHGALIPDQSFESMKTLQDLYDHYVIYASRGEWHQ